MKIKLVIPIFMLCLTTLYADRLVELEKQMEQVRIITPNETCGANTALARPILDPECGCCGTNLFISASALCWHPKVAGTEFAYGVTNCDTNVIVPMNGCLKSIDFRWNWGFKIGLGYNIIHDGWGVFLEYTWFTSHGSQSSGSNNSVVALKGLPFLGTSDTGSTDFLVTTRAQSSFGIGLNTLQLDFGRAFYLSEYLAFHPKLGLRAAWVGLRQNTRYGLAPGNFLTVRDCSRFSGIGPDFGIGSQWHFCNSFYIYGDVYGSLMYGLFNAHHKERACSNVVRICQTRHAFVPLIDTRLGLGYSSYCGCDGNMHIMLQLGFDAQYIWRINQMLEVKDSSALRFGRISEDLSLHGISFNIRIDF